MQGQAGPAGAGRLWAVVVAAGTSRRMGSPGSKVWIPVGRVPLLVHTLRPWQDRRLGLAGGVLVVAAGDVDRAQALLRDQGWAADWTVTAGGAERHGSVRAGMEALRARGLDPADVVLIHDGARPLADAALISRVAAAARAAGAAVPVVDLADTIKLRGGEGQVAATVDRRTLAAAQTPQGVRAGWWRDADARWSLAGLDRDPTDDAELLERAGYPVQLVPGEARNRKVTTPADLAWVTAALGVAGPGERRWGQGLDVHPLVAGRPLVLGGVTVPHTRGLAGDSDGDVLTHAVMDAILGALAWGDLGEWFRPDDPGVRGAASLTLLARILDRVQDAGWQTARVDATLVAQAPRLAPYRQAIRERLAAALGVDPAAVSVKLTTTDGLGFAGRQEGIAALALVELAAVAS
ncbi:2-C-methyl-D-erythritol 4-phosphate cytidylyltransferase / 2-C-methyl-D-erythritol 2,4-cyclodiphosphate synthase [Candidatus Hydrogenisulfobacillus filiaventi]|uniref:Bifunctional enzyme IspD/IspF n=1 Tax=Candidatus Hydrogenisulfobacillus filiaventi TaxID=2707344 RepID=A0A6F8ZJL9_9FIRM|nr:2-C-methyl-D-erythritol 2,4-cyclodiphosphate synthase [Bacillota bacterium]CAB1129986.1 2-C-methyl-D-erythritol 4-phosphate cytidylyltransferase / 2-C-methyl-D-erythritol 2,4-cyclodiphosphate synthase [Candidatus Hydrogenisulfobacillus filiaventi]